MARYFGAMRQVIERHGGTVEKFIGDAVMAVFGVPVLHEDDALRAVRAVCEMREALVLLNEELERDYGTRLALRIGVNTGEVVTGTEERLATGDAVNVAARLEQAAPPGEILVGAETLALVRDAVEVEPLAPLELKGKSEPLARSGFGRRVDAPMVGRGRELRRMADSFEQARADRSCQLFTVLGAAGVGKSRLAAELRAATDATVVQGRWLDYGDGITYWPVVEVLKQLLGTDEQARLSPHAAGNGSMMRLAPVPCHRGDPGPPRRGGGTASGSRCRSKSRSRRVCRGERSPETARAAGRGSRAPRRFRGRAGSGTGRCRSSSPSARRSRSA